MRKYLLIPAGLLLLTALSAQTLTFTPENPAPGEKITLTYDPSETPLGGAAQVEAVAYLIEDELPTAHKIKLKPSNRHFLAELSTAENTKAVVLRFTDGAELKDDKVEGMTAEQCPQEDWSEYYKLYTCWALMEAM